MRNLIKILLVLMCLGLFVFKSTDSYAYWGRGHVWIGVGIPGPYYYGYPYYPYYNDPYYAPAYAVASTTNYQPVVVNGTTYYVNNGLYYVYTQYGYQAVAAPTGAPAPASIATATVTASTDDSVTVNVPNSKGGYTPVVLKKSGTGFVGPQGEFYSEFPKVSQLQLMYGK